MLQTPNESCSDFCISVGLAEGKSDQGIESVVKLADSKCKPVACFRYELPGKIKVYHFSIVQNYQFAL